MKMKKAIKKIFIVLMCLSIAAVGFGCKGKDETKEFDRAALEEDVLENVEFSIELEPLNPVVFSIYYEIPEGVDSSIYQGGGASPDVFATFNASDEEGVKATVKMLEERVHSLKTDYTDYDAAELKKIDNAIIKTYETYIIYCITDDYENANKIIDGYIS